MHRIDVIPEACRNRGVVFTSIWATNAGKEAMRKEGKIHGCFLCKDPLRKTSSKGLKCRKAFARFIRLALEDAPFRKLSIEG